MPQNLNSAAFTMDNGHEDCETFSWGALPAPAQCWCARDQCHHTQCLLMLREQLFGNKLIIWQ